MPRPGTAAGAPVPVVASLTGSGGIATRLMPLLLLAVGVAAYYSSFDGVFLLDDRYRIVDNPHIRRLWPPWGAMADSSRPVVDLSLAVNYALGGLSAHGYHAFNLAVHLLAGLTLFGVVRRMLESKNLRTRYGHVAPWLALAVALIWTVHPLQTESVTYVIQRAESLMGLMYLLTLYCGIRGCESSHQWAWFSAAVTACAVGMGSKEVMVTAPIMMLLYDRVFISASFREIARRRRGLYLGLASTWVVLGALVATHGSAGLTGTLTPRSYGAAQLGIVAHYLRLSIWPRPLVFDYAWRLPETIFSVLPSAVVLVALAGGAILASRRWPWVGFWTAWIFLILAPTSSIFPIADLAFEHRMYLSLAGIAVLIVVGAHETVDLMFRRLRMSRVFGYWLKAGLALTVVFALAITTVLRNEDYRSEFAMWAETVAKRPDNPRAHNNLGIGLERQGRTDEAMTHFAVALRLKPDYADAHINLARGLLMRGRNREAIAHYSQAVRLDPNSSTAHHNLGVALYRDGLVERAVAEYSEAIRLNPAIPEARRNLGVALARQGKMDEAIAQLSEALRLKPDYADAHDSLGRVLYLRGQREQARAHFAEAVRLEPNFENARNNLRAAEAGLQEGKERP